ncbi:unnamed protein product [Schistosoma mattheei]|uniref:Uncharacterized protein n=1 Tax=Schistosoma mattheei TaxID=31246 RepID=A0A183NQB6_9TREM|nr:unnamed protein product [Schistosoma mattheei]
MLNCLLFKSSEVDLTSLTSVSCQRFKLVTESIREAGSIGGSPSSSSS